MKPLTRIRRAAIYRQVAELVFRNTQKGYVSRCCIHLGDTLPRGFVCTSERIIRKTFDEIYFFEHSNLYSNGWWDDDLEGNNCRILALLLSAEIALKP